MRAFRRVLVYNSSIKKKPKNNKRKGNPRMAIIPQKTLFRWNEIEELGDLERLDLVIKNMPDEELMVILEEERGIRGRDDYPIRAMWNSILAGVLFQHVSIESLRRELSRNAQSFLP